MKRLLITTCIAALAMTAGTGSHVKAKAEMPKPRASISVKGWKPFASVPTTVSPARTPLRSAGNTVLNLPEMNGNVLWPSNSPHYLTMSLLPSAAGEELVSLSPSGLTANGGGVLVNGIYYCGTILSGEGYEEYMLFSFDGTTWAQLSYETCDFDMMATDVALDPTDNKVYGCFYGGEDGNTPELGCVDYIAKTRSYITTLDKAWSGCAINAQGQLFAIDMDGMLMTADKNTGVVTEIGATGLDPVYLSSACIDPYSGRMFYSYCPADDSAWLYEIDTTTAQATPLYRFPADEEIVGMYVCPARTSYEAPAAVNNLNVLFDGGSLEGQVSFTAPTTKYSGETATGALTYSVVANGSVIASGETQYGADITTAVSVPEAGVYTIAATVANAEGSSPATDTELYIGHDTPVAPTVTATHAGGNITISWQPVTTGINHGYVEAAAVTYTVTRLSDNSVIAENTGATSVTDAFGEPEQMTSVAYSVTASANGRVSQAGVSNTLNLGPIVPPFFEDFQEQGALDKFTIINANNDNREWYQFWGTDNNGRARIGYNSTKAMDDWLITPALRLEGGKIYVLRVDCAKEGGAINTERIEVKYGTDSTVEAMTLTAIPRTDVTSNTLTTISGTLAPTESGIYYVGFHGCSDKDKFWLHLDNIDIEAGAIAAAPNVVTNLEVVPGSYGRHQAEIACNVPTTTFDGQALEEITKVEIKRDGELIFTIDNPAPAQLILRTDLTPEAGTHTYAVTAWNAAGEGKPAYATVYIGTKTPVQPKNLKVKETDTHGEVTLTWQAPDRDTDGNIINPDAVSYDIFALTDGELAAIETGHQGLSYTFDALDTSEQQFGVFAIRAVTEGGASAPLVSDVTPIGEPYALTYSESFANAQPSTIFASQTDMGNGRWGMLNDSSLTGVTSADADNGYAAMTGTAYNDRASLITGKVDLRSAATPQLSVKAFNMTGSVANSNPLEIYVNDGNGYTSLHSTILEETGPENEWNPIVADLTPYKGKEVWFKFSGKIDVYTYILLDDLKVVDTTLVGIWDEETDHVKVTTTPGTIRIAGAEGETVAVYTTDGRTLYTSQNASSAVEIHCIPGVYIVKTADRARLVMVP